ARAVSVYGSMFSGAVDTTQYDIINNTTIVDGLDSSYIFDASQNMEITGMMLSNGFDSNGGAITFSAGGRLKLTSCIFQDNASNSTFGTDAGALYINNPSSNVTIDRCFFQGNQQNSVGVNGAGAIAVETGLSLTVT